MKILQVAFLLLFNYLDSLPKLYYILLPLYVYILQIMEPDLDWSDYLKHPHLTFRGFYPLCNRTKVIN